MSEPTRRPPFFTVEQLAERWLVSERTVRRMVERGELRAIRVGPQLRISSDVVDRFEARHSTRPRDGP